MLLATDVGNTHITCGVFEDKNLKTTFRLTSDKQMTSDEYGIVLINILRENRIDKSLIDAVIISSVVPDLMYSLSNSFVKYFDIQPLIVEPGIKTGIRIVNDNPKEVGTDRIVDLAGAYNLYGGPAIVIDFGTATTYDVLTEDAEFGVGLTSPGIEISARALWKDAAKLPKIEILKPPSILARDTISSMQAGLVYGYIGQVEYIVRKLKEGLNLGNIKVIATGGLGKIIYDGTDCIDVYNPDLTMQGLRIIYEKNKKSR